MTRYTVEFSRAAEKALAQLQPQIRRRVDGAIQVLSIDPYPPNSRPVKGTTTFRLRAADYRIIYRVDHGVLTVIIFDIGHRRNIYRKF